MKNITFCLSLMIATIGTNTVYAQVTAEEGGSGSAETATNIGASEPVSGDNAEEISTLADCTTTYWLHSNHKWKWRDYGVYGYNELKASSNTTLGSTTESCGQALVVDRLSVSGFTIHKAYPSQPGVWDPVVNKTVFNTSAISDDNRIRWAGTADVTHPCGAEVYHEASKNGVTWGTVTKSGCR